MSSFWALSYVTLIHNKQIKIEIKGKKKEIYHRLLINPINHLGMNVIKVQVGLSISRIRSKIPYLDILSEDTFLHWRPKLQACRTIGSVYMWKIIWNSMIVMVMVEKNLLVYHQYKMLMLVKWSKKKWKMR